MTFQSEEYQVNQHYNYTRLTFDGVNLLLFHHDTHFIEPAAGLNIDARSPRSVGSMMTQQGDLPAYCLNGQLELMDEMSLSRKISLILPAGEELIAVMCEKAEIISSHVPRLSPMPECMRSGDSPVSYMSVGQNGVDLVMHANDLIHHIHWLSSGKTDALAMQKTG